MNDLLLAGAMVAIPGLLLFAVQAARWPALAVCLVPLSFPIEQLELPGLPMRVVQLTTLAAIALVVLHQRRARGALLPRSSVLFAVALVVLSALVSTVLSVDPAAALRLDGGYLLGLGFASVIPIACLDRRSLRLLIGCTCLVGVVICAAGLSSVTQLRAYYGASVVDNRATGFFGQPNELGAFAAIMAVLGLGMIFSLRGRLGRLLSVAGVLICLAALVASLSRGSWLGLALGLAVFVILAPKARRLVMRGLIAALALVAATVAALPSSPLVSIVVDRAASLVDGRRNPYDDRPAIWREALRQIGQRPLVGSGPGGYPVLALRSPSQVTTVAPNHAHDLALTVTAEQGVLGVVALIIAMAVAVVAVVRTIRWHDARPDMRTWVGPGNASRGNADSGDGTSGNVSQDIVGSVAGFFSGTGSAEPGDRELLAGVVAALAVVLGQGVLDYPLRNPVIATTIWLLVGLLAATVSVRGQALRHATENIAMRHVQQVRAH